MKQTAHKSNSENNQQGNTRTHDKSIVPLRCPTPRHVKLRENLDVLTLAGRKIRFLSEGVAWCLQAPASVMMANVGPSVKQCTSPIPIPASYSGCQR